MCVFTFKEVNVPFFKSKAIKHWQLYAIQSKIDVRKTFILVNLTDV